MRGDIGITLSAMPTQSNDVSHCECGGWLWFTTDTIGRTVENCEGCDYHGPQRTQSTKAPKWTRRSGYQTFSATCSECSQGFTYTKRHIAQGGIPTVCSDCKRLIRANNGKRKNNFPQLMVGRNDPNRDDAA